MDEKIAQQAREEIAHAILFYQMNGWDWLDVVSFIAAKATGHWPPPPREYRPLGCRGGRPRKVKPTMQTEYT